MQHSDRQGTPITRTRNSTDMSGSSRIDEPPRGVHHLPVRTIIRGSTVPRH